MKNTQHPTAYCGYLKVWNNKTIETRRVSYKWRKFTHAKGDTVGGKYS